MKRTLYLYIFLLLALLSSCGGWKEPAAKENAFPVIFPDYVGVTVPQNVAPLNFGMEGAEHIQAIFRIGEEVVLKSSGDSFVDIDIDDWRELLDKAVKSNAPILVEVQVWDARHTEGVAYKPFSITASGDEVDSYVAYRLIPPGYELWSRMGLYQRDLTSFDETAIIENSQNNRGCVNCHSFADYDPEKGMMFHARGEGGGTVVYQKGSLEKIALEKIGPQRSGTYPMWHPSGNFIVFSSNMTRQSFYAHSKDKIEVYDQKSDLILYDVAKQQVYTDERFTDSLNWETFPAFSPDGKWLYFCTAKAVKMPMNYNDLRYSICRVPFNETTGQFGAVVDTVYSASKQGGSVSFPRISPDGKYLMYTWAECATFPIHHKEADIKMLDLATGNAIDVNALSSNDVDSYHSWDSSGKWIVLSSKRIDGRYTRLFLSHWDGKSFSKPMLIPQRDPQHNMQRVFSYNIPEFIKAKFDCDKEKMAGLFKVE